MALVSTPTFPTCAPYLQGLRWLVGLSDHGLNGILADDMVSSILGESWHCPWHVVITNSLGHKVSHCAPSPRTCPILLPASCVPFSSIPAL